MNAAIRLVLTICLILTCTLPLSACNDGTGASVRYDISASVAALDPQYADTEDAKLIVNNAFEGLFERDSQGNAVPAAAERLTLSDDGLTATVTLRSGLKWSDESDLTADDFAFALRRLFTPGYPSAYAVDFTCLKNAEAILAGRMPPSALGVRAADERTLVLTLEYPTDHLPYLLCSTAAMPCKQSFFEETRGRYGLERDMLLYNGPFRVYYWEEDMVQLRLNESYREAGSVLPRSVTFRISEQSERFARLESGKTDAAVLSYAQWNGLKNQESYAMEQYEDTVWALVFNERNTGDTENERFLASFDGRRALTMSVDHRAFAPELGYDLVETKVFLPPTLRLYDESYRKLAGFDGPDLFDAESARSYYQAASRLYGSLRSMTILAPEDPAHAITATAIQRCWRDALALNANLLLLPENELLERVRQGDFQAAILPLRPDSQEPGAMLSGFRSASANNFAGYSSTEYDRLLENASAARTEEQRLDAYRKAERLLYEDAVLVPLYFQTHYYVLAPGVSGIRFSPFAGDTLFRGAVKR